MRINLKAVVPTLVHDGQIVTESTVIAEYFDEVFSDPPLKPAVACDRQIMQL
jgi:glutathione S-transferase